MSENALLDLASRQHGLVEWTQAVELVSEKWIRHAVRVGRLFRAQPAVYRFAAAPVTHEQLLLAPCLAAGVESAVSHRAAAHEWVLGDFPDVLEIVTPRAQWPRMRGVRVHRSTDLRADHVTTRRGIPFTKPMRTLVDLGQSAPWAVGEALERGLTAKLFGFTAVDVALDDFSRRGRTGVGILRRIVDERALGRDVPESLLESKMARLLQSYGLPQPRYQHWVTPEIRVDFAYVGWKIAIEVDGFGAHGTPAALSADLERQNALVLLGWTVLRFTWKQVVCQSDNVAKTILVTLTALEGRSA